MIFLTPITHNSKLTYFNPINNVSFQKKEKRAEGLVSFLVIKLSTYRIIEFSFELSNCRLFMAFFLSKIKKTPNKINSSKKKVLTFPKPKAARKTSCLLKGSFGHPLPFFINYFIIELRRLWRNW